jgi:16S rRNA processing protein RimM
MARETFLAIGTIVKAFGIRGEVVVRAYTDSTARFQRLKEVHVGPDAGRAAAIRIDRTSVEPRGVRLKLAGIDDRNAAEALVGSVLFVDDRHRAKPPRGRFFIHEVIGLRVCDEEGRVLGTVREVLKMPAQDVYVVERHGRDVMIPAVKEFVREIDPVAGIMRVRLIEGLLEE